MKKKPKIKLKKFFPFFFIAFIWFLFFWKFFLKGLLPIPADITVGAYYPWLDYKWGFPTGVPIKNPLPSDIPSLLYPWRLLVIEAYQNHQWPLWNPGYFLGMPLMANFQSAAFSLSNLFFLFFKPILAWSWGVVAQSFFSLLFMYLYLRLKRLAKIPSLLGAVIYSFSGFAVVWHQYNVHGWTMLFLPLILYLTEQYFASKKAFWGFLLSLSAAFQIFSGYLPLVIFTWLVVGLFLLWKKQIFQKHFFFWLLFVVLGFGLAAIQLLPGIELIGLSIRKIDPLVEASQASYLSLAHLITLIIPNFFGNPATLNYWGQAFYDNYAFWVGAIPLALAFLALGRRKKSKEVIFWWGIILLGFVLAVKNPLGIFMNKLLFLEGGVAARALFLTNLAFSVLAAIGLDYLLKDKLKGKSLFRVVGGIASILGVFAFLALKEGASLEQKNIALRNSVIPLGVFLVFGVSLLGVFFWSKLKRYLHVVALWIGNSQLI